MRNWGARTVFTIIIYEKENYYFYFSWHVNGILPSNVDGRIYSASEAREAAEKILSKIYGEKIAKSKKAYKVYFDKNIWLVHGTLPKGLLRELKMKMYKGE